VLTEVWKCCVGLRRKPSRFKAASNCKFFHEIPSLHLKSFVSQEKPPTPKPSGGIFSRFTSEKVVWSPGFWHKRRCPSKPKDCRHISSQRRKKRQRRALNKYFPSYFVYHTLCFRMRLRIYHLILWPFLFSFFIFLAFCFSYGEDLYWEICLNWR
jgi:hypothetical protein